MNAHAMHLGWLHLIFFYCGKLSKHAQAPIRMFWKSLGFLGYFSIFLELNLFF
jgi:hypothetical protein